MKLSLLYLLMFSIAALAAYGRRAAGRSGNRPAA
jgi:hypothetical protein